MHTLKALLLIDESVSRCVSQSVFFVAPAARRAVYPAIDLVIISVSNTGAEVLPVTQLEPTNVDFTDAKGLVGVGSFGPIAIFWSLSGGTFVHALADFCLSTDEKENRVPPAAMEVALFANKAEMRLYINNVAVVFIVLGIKDKTNKRSEAGGFFFF